MTTVPHEVTPDGWKVQYRRMERAYDRIDSATGSVDDYLDSLMAYFIYSWALVDWIANDPAAVPAIVPTRKALVDAVFSHDALVRGRDVANGAKHRVLHQQNAGGREAGRVRNVYLDRPRETWVNYAFTKGDTVEGFALAHQMKRAWDTLLPALGLNPHA